MALNIIKDNVIDVVYTRVNKIQPSTYEPDQAIATSYLGTPIYSNLQLKNGQYQDPVTGQIIKYSGLRVDSALFEVSGDKNIVETEVQGRDGTIKELISNRDYRVQISGLLISNLINVAPVEEKNVLIRLTNAKTSLEVSSFLNDFGIYNIVVNSYSISEVQGKRGLVQFSLSCVSDQPYDLEISEENNIG
ncbi:MAG TPA: DUF6046 domain-containing protein [Chryseolinea sp.]|nr:DUF6046 domain-containing protein [Chryseolinea sp.]